MLVTFIAIAIAMLITSLVSTLVVVSACRVSGRTQHALVSLTNNG